MISIQVLGAPAVRRPDGPISGRAAHRRRLALIAIFAAARGRLVARDRIIGLLWPEHATDAARHTLSEGLYVLRKDLGESSFVVMGDEVGLDPARVSVDLDHFERALDEGQWEDAVRAYGGPFLDGFYVSDAPEFERWVEGERDRLARGYGRALEELASAAEAEGALVRAAEWWRRLLAHDAFSSRVALRLVRALERAGERAAALRAAEAHVLLLRQELGVGPDPELAALMDDLRREPPAPPPRPAPSAVFAGSGRGESIQDDAADSIDRPTSPANSLTSAQSAESAVFAVFAASTESAESTESTEFTGSAESAKSDRPVRPRLAEGPARGVPVPVEAIHPRRRGRRIGVGAVAGLAALVLVMAAALSWARGPSRLAGPEYDPRRIAVLYLDDDSPTGDLQYLANGLTELLIHELSQVEALDVVSRNGVKPYRDGTVPFDSMVADLRVGSVVEGSVQRSADSVRVTVQLIDANTHSHLESRVVVRPLGDLFAVQRAVSEEVSGFLRRRLGAQVRMRQAEAETGSADALELVLRGEQAHADALEVLRSSDSTDVVSALRMLGEADALLARAEAADPRWARPTVGRAWVGVAEAVWNEGLARSAALDSVMARAGRVLARHPGHARALEARGKAMWIHAMDPGAEADSLLNAAERDLRAAVAADPSLASAWGTLSFVLMARGRFAESDQAARKAQEHDAWLEDTDELLERRYQSAVAMADYAAARDACERGHHAFPRDWRFTECRLTLLREDASRPADPALAWRLVAELDRLDPPAHAAAVGRAYAPVYRRMIAAAVSARAGDADRARAEVARARVDAAADPEARRALGYDEAYVLLLLGDRPAARARLDAYLAQHPELRGLMERDPLVRQLLTAPSGAR